MADPSFSAEIAISIVALVIYAGGTISAGRAVWAWMAMGGIIVAAVATASPDTGIPMVGAMDGDSALAFRWIALAMGGLLLAATPVPPTSRAAATFAGSILMAVLGVLLVGRADGLVLSFLGVELVGFAVWSLMIFGPQGKAEPKDAARYLLTTAVGTGVLFYGMGFLLCTAGSADLETIRDRLGQLAADGPGGPILLAKIGLLLILVGLGLKIAAPACHFHRTRALVASWPALGIAAVVPLIAAVIVLIRVVVRGCEPLAPLAFPLILLSAMASITAGNLTALFQTNPWRLLVYSSLAQAGYLLIGPAVEMADRSTASSGFSRIGTVVLGMPVFIAATIGLWAALSCLGRGGNRIEHLGQLAGLAWTKGLRRRLLAWSIGVFMLSLAGIPPLAGFWGRILPLAEMLSAGGTEPGVRSWLVVAAAFCVVNSVVAAVYYLRVVAVLFFHTPLGTPRIEDESEGPFLVAVCSALVLVVVGVYPQMVVNLTFVGLPAWPG